MARLVRLVRKSLTAHLALIFTATALIGLLLYAQTTEQAWPDAMDPLETEAIDATIALDGLALPGASLADVLNSPQIARIASPNPNFGFIVQKGSRSWVFNEKAAPVSVVDTLRKLELLEKGMPKHCSLHDVYGRNKNLEQYILNFRLCNEERTVLFVFGISSLPKPIANEPSWGGGEDWLRWNGFYDYGLGALAALVYIGVAIFWVRRTLGKVEDAGNDLLHDHPQSLIPEDKVPLEFLPLIRAVNAIGMRAADSLQRQQFFLGAAAHELRTPLTIMRLRIEELPAGDIKSEFLSDLRRLSGVMNGLLEFMRVTAIDAKFAKVDLGAACGLAMQRVCASADRTQVVLDFKISSSQVPIEIEGVEELIVLALTNVLQNAISYSRRGDVIKIVLTDGPTISVTDNGPGFAQSVISAIGQPFHKYPSERSGSGLGFSIVERVMNLHAGKFHVSNGTECGAVVTLDFTQNK